VECGVVLPCGGYLYEVFGEEQYSLHAIQEGAPEHLVVRIFISEKLSQTILKRGLGIYTDGLLYYYCILLLLYLHRRVIILLYIIVIIFSVVQVITGRCPDLCRK